MHLEEFLDQLHGARKQGRNTEARCPAHDDKHASLSVTEGAEGRILLRCHAGCSALAVVTAMGLTLADLFPRRDRALPDRVYPYVDERGSALYEVVRYPGKRFRQRHHDPASADAKADGYVYHLDGVQRVLYKLPQVIEAVVEGRRIYITEGEKDADRITKETGRCATCNPGGAGKWRPEYNQYLAGARVCIVQDRDDQGRRHARRVKEELTPVAAEVVIYQAAHGKDISNHFDAGLRMEQMEKPRATPARGIVTAEQMADSGLEYLNYSETDLPGWQLIDGLLATTVRPGRLYACGAYTGDGKTTYALQGARKLASEGVRVGYFSMEMTDADLRNRLIAHCGVPLWTLERPWLLHTDAELMLRYHQAIEEMRDWSLDVIYDTTLNAKRVVEETIEREYDFVVVDHVHRFGWGDRRELEKQIQALTNLTLDANVPLLVLCQLRRYQRGKDMVAYPPPVLQDFRETEMLGNESSLAFAIWRQRDSEGLRYIDTTSQFRVLKNRHTTKPEDRSGHVDELAFDTTTGLFSKRGISSDEPPEPQGELADWGVVVNIGRRSGSKPR